ncbi:MAG: ATP-grasp domain-containing protein [Candidatus Odinarchaeota archaeon]
MKVPKARHRKILVVAVNARPIVESVLVSQQTLAGCVDYFGDYDLVSIMRGKSPLFSVIKQEPGKFNTRELNRPLSEILMSLTEIMTEEIEFDYILFGSGIRPDDHKRLEKLGTVLGSTASTLERVRDREFLYNVAENTRDGIKTPKIKLITDKNSLMEEILSENNTERIIKSVHSEGGLNTVLINKNTTLDEKNDYSAILDSHLPCYVLEYLKGLVFSVSVISTGDRARVMSYNLQLSGLKLLNSPGHFTYSGNIVPLTIEKKVLETIYRKKDFIEELTVTLGLKGTIGYDFIIDERSDIYLLEVNPRVQGTLEPFELSSGLNMVDAVLDCFEGEILPAWKPDGFKNAAVKLVLYTPSRTVIPLLKNLFPVKDIPLPGSITDMGHPLCTYIEKKPLSSSDEILKEAQNQVSLIYNSIKG